jgi:hypothetical protein
MTDRPFRVIERGGKPEPDEALVSSRKDAVAAIETAESFWLYVEVGDEYQIVRYGDALVQSARIEEMARARKMEALGFWDDEE